VRYGVRWRFQYNPGKCKVMIYGREKREEEKFVVGDEEIECVEKYKYLGVWFDRRLNIRR